MVDGSGFTSEQEARITFLPSSSQRSGRESAGCERGGEGGGVGERLSGVRV